MKTFRPVFLIALLSMSLGLAVQCRTKGKSTIAVVPKGQAHLFFQTVHAGANAAGEEFGLEILWNGPAVETEFARQISIVEDFISRRVDGIALAPSHGKSLVPIVEKAVRENIPVVIFDSGIETEQYVSYVSTDNYKGGVLAARRMGEILEGHGKIAILGVIPGSVSTAERENGFKETIAKDFPGVQIVAFQYGMGEQAKSLSVAEDILTANPELNAIFAANESSSVGTVQAVKLAGRVGKVKIVGFDSSPTLIDDLRAGAIDGLVLQNPFKMGYEAVRQLHLKLSGQAPERRVDTGATLVTRANLESKEIQDLINPPLERYLK